MPDPRHLLKPGDALLVVDVQVDFCPGGALPIPEGDLVVPVCNTWIERASEIGIAVYASRDWHPRSHPSFLAFGGPWPPHCVQDTPGARFHPALLLPDSATIVTKGTRFDRDQYSAFDETGLAVELRRRDLRRIFIGGLAQDVCVRATALGARLEGFEVVLIADASRPVTIAGGEGATLEMQRAGILVATTNDALGGV
jgi:nicotinamidase/pyrazinamidase